MQLPTLESLSGCTLDSFCQVEHHTCVEAPIICKYGVDVKPIC